MRCVKISDKAMTKTDEKSAQSSATLNSNISSYKQAFDIVQKARINYYTWTYEVCQNK